jgi:nucleotide-binding universal stress UspA family protein
MANSLFGKILVANDGSEGARKALAAAIELAQIYEAEMHVVTVEERLPQHEGSVICGELRSKTEAADYLRRTTIQAGLLATNAGMRVTPHVLAGHEVETIVTFLAEHRFDLLVVGFMGHSKIFGDEWGSTSQNLTRLASCAVLVVK